MIHIIDPRISRPLMSFSLEAKRNGAAKRLVVPRYTTNLQMHSAMLIAVRQSNGLYKIIKDRHCGGTGRCVRLKTLINLVSESLGTTEELLK